MFTESPWPKGVYPTYSAFVIEVGVRKDRTGGIQTYKRLQGAQDLAVTETLGPSRGLEEGALALLTESVRTEAILQLLIKLSNDPEFKEKLSGAESAPDELIEKLADDTLEQIQRSIAKMVPGIAREATEHVQNGLRG